MQIARIIFTAATASFISLTKDATVKTSRVFVVLALFSFETNLLGLAAVGCCSSSSCVARRMLQMLQMLQHSRQLSWQLCASFHLLCLCLSPVSGYFHCQIYFKWVQLSAQLFLFAFRICFCPLPFPILSFFLPFRAKMLRIFHTHTQRRQGYAATDTFAVTVAATDTFAVAVASIDTDTDTDTVAHTDTAEISGGGGLNAPSRLCQ